MSALSPFTHKLIAVAALLSALWVVALSAATLVSARLGVARETSDAVSRYEMLRSRRVNIESLQRQLAELESSEQVKASLVRAANPRAAVATVQQLTKSAIEGTGGRFLSSVESAATPTAGTVAVQFRARVAEKDMSAALAALEKTSPQLDLDELQLTTRAERADAAADIEVNAVVRARWSPDGRLAP